MAEFNEQTGIYPADVPMYLGNLRVYNNKWLIEIDESTNPTSIIGRKSGVRGRKPEIGNINKSRLRTLEDREYDEFQEHKTNSVKSHRKHKEVRTPIEIDSGIKTSTTINYFRDNPKVYEDLKHITRRLPKETKKRELRMFRGTIYEKDFCKKHPAFEHIEGKHYDWRHIASSERVSAKLQAKIFNRKDRKVEVWLGNKLGGNSGLTAESFDILAVIQPPEFRQTPYVDGTTKIITNCIVGLVRFSKVFSKITNSGDRITLAIDLDDFDLVYEIDESNIQCNPETIKQSEEGIHSIFTTGLDKIIQDLSNFDFKIS